METAYIISQLSANRHSFSTLLKDVPAGLQTWRQQPDKWCLLEIVCHLYDEEREDFRARIRLILKNSAQTLASINPVAWVSERKYMEQNYSQKLHDFLAERESSINWLSQLNRAVWDDVLHHPTLGDMSAYKFLANWLAHDYLHFRQINRLKYDYLAHTSRQDLSYAGGW